MRVAVLPLSAVLLWPAAASTTTYLVRPDGTGDFPTIQAGVDGDVTALGDGTFRGPGNRDISYSAKALTLRSVDGVSSPTGVRAFRGVRGTHFLQNLTSFGMGYFTVHQGTDGGWVDNAWLEAQPAAEITPYLRHIRLALPLDVRIDGRLRKGVVRKGEPGRGERPGR